MEWRLIKDGKELERHPHHLTCVIAAFERGLVLCCRGRKYLNCRIEK